MTALIIGLDLDNTIVECESLFRQKAAELLGNRLAGSTREDIRALVRKERGDRAWTEIQAEVYGADYQRCTPFPYAVETIGAMVAQGHEIFIISHKTLTDAAGKGYRLQEEAMRWVEAHLFRSLHIKRANVLLVPTAEEKIELIQKNNCAVFLDDLPEILLPLKGRIAHPVLFAPEPERHRLPGEWRVCNWEKFGKFVYDA